MQFQEEIRAMCCNPKFLHFIRKHHSEAFLSSNFEYFVLNIDRILANNYVPSQQDVLQSRILTTGIAETEFTYKHSHFRIYDGTHCHKLFTI